MPDSSTRTWREAPAVLGLMAIGAALRFYTTARLGLTHFDEGVYALAGNWMFMPHGLGDLNASIVPYSPPAFPILVGLSYALFGFADVSAILVAQVAGVLCIPSAAWVGRRTFGPGAGAAAAAFAALSGPHVAFSRVALTDTTFLLAWLVALGTGMRFLERPGLGRALVFGLAVGLAQNVKYNGYLAGAIVALVAVWDILGRRALSRREAIRLLALGVVAAAAAAVVYLPWFLFVERTSGGYAGLIEHHRKYLGGWRTWYPFWKLQMDQQVALSGGPEWSMAAWALGWVGALVVLGRAATREPFHLLIGLLAGAAVLAFAPNLPWWLGLGAVPWLLRDSRPSVRVLGAWWLVLTVLTPFYHPYARLWLPLEAAGWVVLAGVAVEGLAARRAAMPAAGGTERAWRRRLSAGAWAGLGCGLLALWFAAGPPPHPRPLRGLLDPTDSVQVVAKKISTGLPPSVAGLHNLVRPPVTFYLAGKFHVVNEQDSAALLQPSPPGVWSLVDGALLRQEGDEVPALHRLQRSWIEVTAFPIEPSLPALLDEDPSAAYEASAAEQSVLHLLRPRLRGPLR